MLADIKLRNPISSNMSISIDNYSNHEEQYTNQYEMVDPSQPWSDWYKNTKETTRDLELFFRLRADIEEDYAQKLSQLSKLKLGINEKWSLSAALKTTLKEVEAVAHEHAQIANKIRTELQVPSLQSYDNHRSSKKNLYKNLLTKTQDRDGYAFMLSRAKERLLEIQQIGNDSTRYNAEQELQLSQARYEEADHQHSMELEKIANGHRTLEHNRIQFIRNTLWRYTNLLSGVCVSDDESLEKVRRELEKCDAKSHIETLSESIKNGSHLDSNSDYDSSNHLQSSNNSLNEKQSLNNLNTATMPERSSPLRNEIRKPNDPKFNQLMSSLSATNPSENNSPKSQASHSPATPVSNERSKLISSELVNATIARSPILAAKRSSTSNRPVSRTPTIPSTLGGASPAQFSSPNPSNNHGFDPMRSQGPLERSSSNISKHSHNGSRPLSSHEEYCHSPSNLQRSFSAVPNSSYVRANSHPQAMPNHPGAFSPGNIPPNYHHGVSGPYQDQRMANISPPGPYSPAHIHPNMTPITKGHPGNGIIQNNPQYQIQSQQGTPRSSQPQPQAITGAPISHVQPHPISTPHSRPTSTPSPTNSGTPTTRTSRPDSRPILFYVKAMYDYEAEIPEEISLVEGQIVSVLATQLDGWWEGEIQDSNGVYQRGIFPSNFTEPVSM